MRMDAFGTHQALLVAAIAQTGGPIIEIGGGWYSTPLINALATAQRRRAYTMETGEYVYNILQKFNSEIHSIRLMEGFHFDRLGKFNAQGKSNEHHKELQRIILDNFINDQTSKISTPSSSSPMFSVAFVDQSPGFLREPAIRFFADKAEFVITHDSEHVNHYHLEPTMSSFKYRWDFRLHRPNSVILSNFRPCDTFAFLAGNENSGQVATV